MCLETLDQMSEGGVGLQAALLDANVKSIVMVLALDCANVGLCTLVFVSLI